MQPMRLFPAGRYEPLNTSNSYPRAYTRPMPAQGDLLGRLRAHCSQSGVDLGVLFGSHATGRVRPGSDIDVALLLQDDSPDARRRAEVDLQRALGGNADVTFLADAPPQLRFEIARAGILAFERQPGLWGRERVRAMVDWGDWAPIARRIHAAGVERLRKRSPA